ncbi:MAG: hypothetical protein HS116_10170 [Planctomycetes bacterium]|nr:hypothetical protein [Planctomycetota bacterium]
MLEADPIAAAERLVRIEAQLDALVLLTSRLHGDMKEQLDLERRRFEALEARAGALEREAERTRTHLAWMKGVWAAVQAPILAWLGMK